MICKEDLEKACILLKNAIDNNNWEIAQRAYNLLPKITYVLLIMKNCNWMTIANGSKEDMINLHEILQKTGVGLNSIKVELHDQDEEE